MIFGGFSSQAIIDRVNDAGAKVIVTADGGYRRGAVVPLRGNVNNAVKHTPTVERVVVLSRIGTEMELREGKESWWHDLMKDASADCPPAKLDSEHPLFILYTSGTTGKPKGSRFRQNQFQFFSLAVAQFARMSGGCNAQRLHGDFHGVPLSAPGTTARCRFAP